VPGRKTPSDKGRLKPTAGNYKDRVVIKSADKKSKTEPGRSSRWWSKRFGLGVHIRFNLRGGDVLGSFGGMLRGGTVCPKYGTGDKKTTGTQKNMGN